MDNPRVRSPNAKVFGLSLGFYYDLGSWLAWVLIVMLALVVLIALVLLVIQAVNAIGPWRLLIASIVLASGAMLWTRTSKSAG